MSQHSTIFFNGKFQKKILLSPNSNCHHFLKPHRSKLFEVMPLQIGVLCSTLNTIKKVFHYRFAFSRNPKAQPLLLLGQIHKFSQQASKIWQKKGGYNHMFSVCLKPGRVKRYDRTADRSAAQPDSRQKGSDARVWSGVRLGKPFGAAAFKHGLQHFKLCERKRFVYADQSLETMTKQKMPKITPTFQRITCELLHLRGGETLFETDSLQKADTRKL